MANSFVHIELNTDDVSKAKQFYSKVFDWKLDDMDMDDGMKYTMVQPGSGTGGGMMTKMMPEAPTMWLPYVAVDSVKNAIGKAKKAGAKILVESQDVMGQGRLGIFIDPTGAACGVWEQIAKRDEQVAEKSMAKPKNGAKKAKPANGAKLGAKLGAKKAAKPAKSAEKAAAKPAPKAAKSTRARAR
jgi:uncharacterized protein